MPNTHKKPFEDIKMAENWGCKDIENFIFVPLTHIIAHVIVNNYELELMGWKFDEKYMLVPKYVVTLITKALKEKLDAVTANGKPSGMATTAVARPNDWLSAEEKCTCCKDDEGFDHNVKRYDADF